MKRPATDSDKDSAAIDPPSKQQKMRHSAPPTQSLVNETSYLADPSVRTAYVTTHKPLRPQASKLKGASVDLWTS